MNGFIWGVIIGIVGIILVLIICLGYNKKLKEYNDEVHKRNLETKQDAIDGLKETVSKLEKDKKELQDKLVAATRQDVETVRLEDISKNITLRTVELDELVGKINELTKWRDEQQGLVKNLLEQKEELEKLLEQLRLQVHTSRTELGTVGAELNRLLEIKKVTEREDNDVWWTPELDSREGKLLTLIREIEDLYPDLRVDLAGIEWKRIWLPKMQDSCRELDGVKGIYRLVLKSDETVGYVGQAVNIKDRWYQHVKKMIGAMVKGNESLYKYDRPDLFYWTVVQQGDDIDLNQSEKYWIEYFGMGLNRKL